MLDMTTRQTIVCHNCRRPADLIEAGIYQQLATTWYAPPHRQISLKLTAKSIGAETEREGNQMLAQVTHALSSSTSKLFGGNSGQRNSETSSRSGLMSERDSGQMSPASPEKDSELQRSFRFEVRRSNNSTKNVKGTEGNIPRVEDAEREQGSTEEQSGQRPPSTPYITYSLDHLEPAVAEQSSTPHHACDGEGIDVELDT